MRLRVRHRILRRYVASVPRAIELVRLFPPSFEGQTVIDWAIEVDHDARLRRARDGYGNDTATVYVEGPTDRLTLAITGEVLTDDFAGQVTGAPDPLPTLLFLQATALTTITPEVRAFAAEAAREADALGRAHDLAAMVAERCEVREEAGFRNAARALAAEGAGVDGVAHLLVAAARFTRLPARVVSGYRFEDGDGSARPHLWSELLVDGYGWIGFDPANRQCPDDRYVRIAVGLDAREAAPLAGSLTPLPPGETA